MTQFRLLRKDEIECRVAQVGKDLSWCSVLLYKDARSDMRILDEAVGPMNWQRHHELINGNLFCTVSIWDDEKKQWISKQDVGVESNTEKEKGQASDAFKRACFNVGIGRELYTAPAIFVSLTDADIRGGKVKTRFFLKELEYENGCISKVVIVDQNGKVRWSMGENDNESAPKGKRTPKVTKTLEGQIKKAATLQELTAIFNANTALQADPDFLGKLSARKHELQQAS